MRWAAALSGAVLALLLLLLQNPSVVSQGAGSEPGYLDFDNLPETNFSCEGKVIGGYYADVETGCQMFHVCTIGQKGEVSDIKFLCLNGTVFDQETRVCERLDEVDCSKTEAFYDLNLELYGNSPAVGHHDDDSEDDGPKEDERELESTEGPGPAGGDADGKQADRSTATPAPTPPPPPPPPTTHAPPATLAPPSTTPAPVIRPTTLAPRPLPPRPPPPPTGPSGQGPAGGHGPPQGPGQHYYQSGSPGTLAALLALHNAFQTTIKNGASGLPAPAPAAPRPDRPPPPPLSAPPPTKLLLGGSSGHHFPVDSHRLQHQQQQLQKVQQQQEQIQQQQIQHQQQQLLLQQQQLNQQKQIQQQQSFQQQRQQQQQHQQQINLLASTQHKNRVGTNGPSPIGHSHTSLGHGRPSLPPPRGFTPAPVPAPPSSSGPSGPSAPGTAGPSLLRPVTPRPVAHVVLPTTLSRQPPKATPSPPQPFRPFQPVVATPSAAGASGPGPGRQPGRDPGREAGREPGPGPGPSPTPESAYLLHQHKVNQQTQHQQQQQQHVPQAEQGDYYVVGDDSKAEEDDEDIEDEEDLEDEEPEAPSAPAKSNVQPRLTPGLSQGPQQSFSASIQHPAAKQGAPPAHSSISFKPLFSAPGVTPGVAVVSSTRTSSSSSSSSSKSVSSSAPSAPGGPGPGPARKPTGQQHDSMHPSELDYGRFLFSSSNSSDAQDAVDAYEDYRDDVDDVQDDPFFDDVPRVNGGRGRTKRDDGRARLDRRQQQDVPQDEALPQEPDQVQHQHRQQQRGQRGRTRASSRAILLEQRGVATTVATPTEPLGEDVAEVAGVGAAPKRRARPQVTRARGRSRYAFMEDPLAAPPPTPSVEPLTSDPLPETDFSCADKVAGGFYADTQVDCQLFHICSQAGNDRLQDNKFMCGPGTRFNQRSRTCQARELVDCSVSTRYYNLNAHFRLPPPEEPVTVPAFDSLKVATRRRRSPSPHPQRTRPAQAQSHQGPGPGRGDDAFRCAGPGLFADVSSGCAMFHVCHADPGASRARLVSTQPCPPGQLFNQGLGSCDTEELVECELLASADQGFGGVARRARRSLAVLVDVVQDVVRDVVPDADRERAGRARRTAPQDGPLEFYYADYDAAAPTSGRRADAIPDGLPRALAASDEQQEYFRYSDAVATVGTPLTTTTTDRQFNPDDYVDDNYEPLIEAPAADSKPSTPTAEKTPQPTTSAPVASATASALVEEDRDRESAERHPPFAVASLRSEAGDPYLPVAGLDSTPGPREASDKPLATLQTPSAASTTDRGLVAPQPHHSKDSDAATQTAAGASAAHRFRVGEKLDENPRLVPSSTPTTTTTTTTSTLPAGEPGPGPGAGRPRTPQPQQDPKRPHKKAPPQRFLCSGRELKAFHADPADCRLFHYCSPGFSRAQVLDFRFRCEEGTVYHRATHRCEPGACA